MKNHLLFIIFTLLVLSSFARPADLTHVPIVYTWGIGGHKASIERILTQLEKNNPEIKVTDKKGEIDLWNRNIYIFQLPPDLKKENVPLYDELLSKAKRKFTINAIETSYSFSFCFPRVHLDLSAEILKMINEDYRFINDFMGAKIIKTEIYSYQTEAGDEILFARFLDGKKYEDDFWKRSLMIQNSLMLNNRKTALYSFPKRYGGYDAIVKQIEKIRTKDKELVLLDVIEFIGHPGFRQAWQAFFDMREKLGYTASLLSPYSLIYGYDFMKEYSRLGKKKSSMSFLASNLLIKENEKQDKELVLTDDTMDEFKKMLDRTLFSKYVIKEINGVKVGVFGLLEPKFFKYLAKEKFPDFEQKDYLDIAEVVVSDLRKKADVVILVVEFNDEDFGVLSTDLRGVDILIGRHSRDMTCESTQEFAIKDFQKKPNRYPYLIAEIGQSFLGRIDLYFDKSKKKPDLKKIVYKKTLLGADVPRDIAVSDIIYKPLFEKWKKPSENFVLPDPKELWEEGEAKFNPRKFWNLNANILMNMTNSEIGLLTIRGFNNYLSGKKPLLLVKDWFNERHYAVTFNIYGKDLRKLIDRFENKKADEDVSYTLLGYDEYYRINGLQIRDDEVYRVASINYFVEQKDGEFRELANITNVKEKFKVQEDKLVADSCGEKLLLKNVLPEEIKRRRNEIDKKIKGRFFKSIPEDLKNFYVDKGEKSKEIKQELDKRLESTKKQAEKVEEERANKWYKDAFEGYALKRGPFLRVNFKELSFNFMNNNMRNNTNYGQVRDSRITTFDQTTLGGEADVYVELYDKIYSWQTGFKLGYTETKLYPQGADMISTELADYIQIYSEYFHKLLRFKPKFFGNSFGPFLSLSYNSEFTATEGNPKSQIFRIIPGVKLYEGTWLYEAKLGSVIDLDFSPSPNDQGYGLYFYAELFRALYKKLTFAIDTDLKYYFLRSENTADDLEVLWELNATLNIPLIADFYVSPFATILFFTGKTVQDFGQSYMLGVALSFKKLWKPQFQSFF